MDRYEKLQKAGVGAYGKVSKARDKISGQLVAIKETRLKMDKQGIPSSSLREISLLQLLSRSIYVVKLLCVEHVFKNGEAHLYMVMEYLDTDLKKFIDCNIYSVHSGYLPPKIIQSFMFQLCKGVAHFHSNGVMHRDLKPHNLLVEKRKGLLKIVDLGLARAFTMPLKSYTHEIATLWYRAPEILLGSTYYSTPMEIWSIGCIFAEMVRRRLVLLGNSEVRQLLHIFRLFGTPTEEMWPGVTSLKAWHAYPQWEPMNLAGEVPNLSPSGVDLLSRMLQCNPANRISAKEALNHPYFDDLDKSQFRAFTYHYFYFFRDPRAFRCTYLRNWVLLIWNLRRHVIF